MSSKLLDKLEAESAHQWKMYWKLSDHASKGGDIDHDDMENIRAESTPCCMASKSTQNADHLAPIWRDFC